MMISLSSQHFCETCVNTLDLYCSVYNLICHHPVCVQSSFVGAIAIGDLIRSTLGPKGMVSVAASLAVCS